MIHRTLRLGLLGILAAGVIACDDDGASPDGTPSTVHVRVYAEDDGENGFTEGDVAISGATVTLVSNQDNGEFTGTTGADGLVTFENVPAGSYTMTHEATPPAGAILTSTETQTIAAPFTGDEVSASFVYAFEPASLSGTLYREENAEAGFQAGGDSTLAGFEVLLLDAADTLTADTVAVDTTGADGGFAFENVARGDYTLWVHGPTGTTLPGGPTYAVALAGGAEAAFDIEFEGGQAPITIAAARDEPLGTPVLVEGVVTAGTDVYGFTSAYFQDETGGIVLDQFGNDALVVVSRGDSIRVRGEVSEFNSELRVGGGNDMTVEILGSADVPAPRTVTATDVNDGLFQGELVTLEGATVTAVDAGFNSTITVTDATGETDIFVDGTTGIDMSAVIVGETYSFTGTMSRFNDIFQIKPRSLDDIALTSTVTGTQPIAVARILPEGSTVTIVGVVSTGSGELSSSSLYMQDPTAGIMIFHGSSDPGAAAGDSIQVTGDVSAFNGEIQLGNVTITNLGTGTLADPVDVNGYDVNDFKYQGELVVSDSSQVVSVGGGGSFTVVMRDEEGAEFEVRVDSDLGLTADDFVVGDWYEVIGVASRFFDTAQIKPRRAADVTAL